MSPALLVFVAVVQTAAPAVAASAEPAATEQAGTSPSPSSAPASLPPVSSSPAVAASGIEIAIAAIAPDAAAAVREDLEELLGRRGVTARYRRLAAVDRDEVVRPSSESPCALACIWIDLGVATPGRAFVYISATASAEVVVRSLPLPSGVDEVAREEVSHIVASSVEALQAGRPLPVVAERADAAIAKATRAPPPPAPVTPTGFWLSAGLGAGAAHEGAAALALPTASLSLLVGPERRRWSPALWVAAGAFSSDASGEPVTLRFRGGELAALASVGTGAGSVGRAAARFGLGPGLELRQATPALAGDATGGVQLDDPRIDPTFFVRAAARFELPLFGHVGLFAAAACDARLVSQRYTINHDGMTQAMFQPDFLRPSILLGVDAYLAGEGRP